MSIQLEQVSKSFAGRAAITDVTIDIADGEFFVLLGPSGSGKSTLLRAIAGLTTVDRGRIVLHGRDVTNVNAREREIGFVFQNYALFRHMTVADNIEFALRAHRVRAAARRRRRQELLQIVALEGLDDRLPGQLSGGQQQRVAVARALAHEPRVLLLDEPFGALDARIRDELRRTIRNIQRSIGITAILVTHDQDEALSMADRIGVMNHARLQEVGEPHILYSKPATRFVATFLGAANLMLGERGNGGIRLGQARLNSNRDSPTAVDTGEVTVVIRPEDVEMAVRPDELATEAIGNATVTEVQFVGSTEKLRLAMPAADSLCSARQPTAPEFLIEATRPASDANHFPVSCGDRVWVGCREFHTLPTPISSIRLHAPDHAECKTLAESPLVQALGHRTGIEPVFERSPADGTRPLGGLIVTSLRTANDFPLMLELLSRGARQVLGLAADSADLQRILICTEPSAAARNAVLASASSLARHLSVEVSMLVPIGRQPYRAARYKELLDIRNASLNQHGLDIRTKTYSGTLRDAISSHRTSAKQDLLIAGVASPSGASRLIAEVRALLSRELPCSLMLVEASHQQQSRFFPSAAYAAATL